MALTRLYTVPGAAEALKMTEAAIWRSVWQGRLTVVKLDSAVRIEEAELARLIEAGRAPGWPPILAASRARCWSCIARGSSEAMVRVVPAGEVVVWL